MEVLTGDVGKNKSNGPKSGEKIGFFPTCVIVDV